MSPTDTFEELLDRGRAELAATRDQYEALEKTETVPAELVELIGKLERELAELDETLNVGQAEIDLAQQTVQRLKLLKSIFRALHERQRTIVEADVSRISRHVSGIATLVRQNNIESRIDHDIDRVEQQYSILDSLLSKGRHQKVITNDRVFPATVDTSIRQVDADLAEHVSDNQRAEAYIGIVEDLLDEIHDALGALGEENQERTAYASDLAMVKEKLQAATGAIEQHDGDDAVQTARTTLEGTLMLHYLTARAHADQCVTEELANTVAESPLSVNCDIKRCVSRGNPQTLLEAITDAVSTTVEASTSERLRQLLEEHDGSVSRTARATDFDIPTIFDHVEQLYNDRQIADMKVTFNR